MDNSYLYQRSDGTSGTKARGFGNIRFGETGTIRRGIRNARSSHDPDLQMQLSLVQPSNFLNLEYLTYLTELPFPITRQNRSFNASGSSAHRGLRFPIKGKNPFSTILETRRGAVGPLGLY